MKRRRLSLSTQEWVAAVTIVAGGVLLFVLIYTLAILIFQLPN